ncbi:MAG TPA: histidinol-phosphate transaminase [Terriglobia bacterium]|nr:histidinol-phosphate transaminase [Terriglobia bacterium]
MPRNFVDELVTPWSREIHPYPPGKPVEEVERELGHAAIKLASNENPLGPSPLAVEAVRRSVERASFYPDGGGYYLREKLAARHGLDMDQVILGAGSTELIELTARTLLVPGDEVVVSESSFYIYETATRTAGGLLVKVPMRGLTCDLEAMARAVTPHTKLVYLGNPNNPTGTIFTADALARFLAALPARTLLALDEAYCDYVSQPGYPRSVEEVRAGKNLLVLRTFSKVHGLAGLRIGYGMAHPDLIAALNRVRSPFNASSVAQAAALAALDDGEHVARSVESNRREMRFLVPELTALGVKVTPSCANFLLIDTGRNCDHDFKRLLHEGVIVRPMGFYGFPTGLRVTVGTHSDNQTFLAALARVGCAAGRPAARKARP